MGKKRTITREFECARCHRVVTEVCGPNKRMCSVCVKESEKESAKRCRENSECRRRLAKEKRSRPKSSSSSMADIIRGLSAYNRRHGTHLSYGKYMQMLRVQEGEARVEVKL